MLVEATRTEAGDIFIGTHITETVASGQDHLAFHQARSLEPSSVLMIQGVDDSGWLAGM